MTILIILLLGIAISIAIYICNREYYLKHRVAIRKLYYGLVVIASFGLWAFGVFPDVGENLQHLIALVISVVIIDLFVFQTPDITKFMTNELKQEGLVESINKNRGTFIELSEKLIKVNEMMPKNLSDWHMDDFQFTPEKYEETVSSYLRTFALNFHLDIFSYQVEASAEEEEFRENVTLAYNSIIKEHGLTTRGVGMRQNQAISTILDGENIEIIEGNSTCVLFPYFGEFYNLLFLVRSKKDSEATGADASLMLNLLYTFDLWLQVNEDQFVSMHVDDDHDEAEAIASEQVERKSEI